MKFYCDALPQITIKTIRGNVFNQQEWGQLLIGGRLQGVQDETGQLTQCVQLAKEKTINNRNIWKAENYRSWRELFFFDFPRKSKADWYRDITGHELRSILC